MGYYIDFFQVSLEEFKNRLIRVNLVPSRMLLRDNIDQQFNKIAAQGIFNIAEFVEAVKNAKKLQHFAAAAGIDEEYLKILKREIGSLSSKPNKLADFQSLSHETVTALEKAGIKNTVQLYDKVITGKSRAGLAEATGIDRETIMTLTKLTDLSRIQWVNHTFAEMLYELGYETPGLMANADPNKLHAELNKLNKEQKIYHHGFGLADTERCIFAAGEIPFEIEY